MTIATNNRICPHCFQRTEHARCPKDGYETVLAPDERSSWSLEPGTNFANKYRVHAQVRRSSAGSRYRATRLDNGEDVALTVLDPWLFRGDGVGARFEEIGDALGSVRHENLVGVSEFGSCGDVIRYWTSEWFDGRVLAEVIDGFEDAESLPEEEVIAYGTQLFRALEALHRSGFVHGNVNPANVMVRHEKLKIDEVGLAAIVNGPNSSSRPERIGEPRYMSPEVARGINVTGAADVYNVGLLLYELLTGRHPFREPSSGDYLIAHAVKAPPWPMVDGIKVRGRLPDLIMACLEKKPEKRPASASLALNQLERAQVQQELSSASLPAISAKLSAVPELSDSALMLDAEATSPVPTEVRFAEPAPTPAPVAVAPAAAPAAAIVAAPIQTPAAPMERVGAAPVAAAANKSSLTKWLLAATLLLATAVIVLIATRPDGSNEDVVTDVQPKPPVAAVVTPATAPVTATASPEPVKAPVARVIVPRELLEREMPQEGKKAPAAASATQAPAAQPNSVVASSTTHTVAPIILPADPPPGRVSRSSTPPPARKKRRRRAQRPAVSQKDDAYDPSKARTGSSTGASSTTAKSTATTAKTTATKPSTGVSVTPVTTDTERAGATVAKAAPSSSKSSVTTKPGAVEAKSSASGDSSGTPSTQAKPTATSFKRTVRVESTPSGASVYLDKKVVGTTPTPVTWTDPNKRVIVELRRTGFKPYKLQLSHRTKTRHSVTLKSATGAAPTVP